MLISPNHFPLCKFLESHVATFKREMDALPEDAWLPWPQPTSFVGGWQVFPIFLSSFPDNLNADFRKCQELCRESAELLFPRQQIVGAAFSRVHPGTHIFPHTDHVIEGVIRVHVGIHVPKGSRLRAGQEVAEWKEDGCLVFDGAHMEHEVGNEGTSPRDVLLIDFAPNAEEWERVDGQYAGTGLPEPHHGPFKLERPQAPAEWNLESA